ncbi:DUF1972 domain-containing protein [Cognaticolwellia aestuarii]|uniref:DUF1972 domain-containing protein n=1 Tax=Cognaticolwellia aestuarii TaxID=329993 RepID=UPI001F1C9432|nr:DUF1972 domain-containing protein [Cognaticolwellia aestuarii]
MKLFVFRSLPLHADSRTQRNMGLVDNNLSYSCTWEKDASISSNKNSFSFPFYKSGNPFLRGVKYILFIFWVPYIVITKIKKDDVIIFMDFETALLGLWAAKLKGIKSIFDIVDPFAQTKRGLRFFSKIIDYLEYRVALCADVVIVPHLSRLKYYKDTIGKVLKPKKLFVVENVPDYSLSPINNLKYKQKKGCRVGYFGTLDYGSRGLEFLISLAKENPNSISVIFAGQGGMEAELVETSLKHTNIDFFGSFNAETLPELYNEVDFTWAYYCPSIPLHKYAAPNKYYEHLYFNTLIITSKVIPQFEVIDQLNSGIAIDIDLESQDDAKYRILKCLEASFNTKNTACNQYWKENYADYYTKKRMDFECILNSMSIKKDLEYYKDNKISIIGTVGVPACYGGFETLVENLLSDDEQDRNITVYCSSKSYLERPSKYRNAKLHYIPLNANGAQSIPYDIWSLCHSVWKGSDNILLLGVSGAICLPVIRLFSKVRIITNIDGLEWKRAKWSGLVKKFLKYSEKLAVKYSDVIVADNAAIADYVRNEYQVRAEVIAYGGDHAVISDLNLSDENYALALCRIEPENNVELILKSFSQTSKKLKFIGNWDNSDFGLAMKSQYQQFDNIDIIDPIYDIKVLFDMRQKCSFYVHGHSAGGTNPSLVEMMHFNKSIFAFDCNYNRASTEDKAEFFSDDEELTQLINKSVDISNGSHMQDVAERRYTWKIVKDQYFSLFK